MASLIKQRDHYYAQFYDSKRQPKRKQVPLKTKTKRVAQQLIRQLEDQYALGEFDPWLDTLGETGDEDLRLLHDATAAFLKAKSHRSEHTIRCYRTYLAAFERFVGPSFPVNSITGQHVLGFLDSTNANDVTRKSYHRHLRVFFRWLVQKDVIRRDVTEDVTLRKVPSRFPRFLMPEDVEKLIQTIREGGYTQWLIPVIEATAHVGLRLGEVCNLQWDCVDLERRMLTVKNTTEFTTKSGKERSIPIPNRAFEVFQQLLEQRNGSGPDGFVFLNTHGDKLTRFYLSRKFRIYRRRAGLPENINFHSLRHTAASWLVMNGASLEAVRLYLGHSTIQVTQKYAHLAPNVFFDQINSALNRIR